jgi:hypothetical protein
MTSTSHENASERDEKFVMSRRSMLLGIGGLAALGIGSSFARPSAAAAAGSPGAFRAAAAPAGLPDSLSSILAEWAKAPGSHSHIGDFRRAGYQRGLVPRPTVNRVTPATFFGIRPGSSKDSSAAIQAALEKLGAQGGGVLLLKKGRYVLDNPIFVHDSNVVLRGEGKESTVLHFTRPLEQSIAPVPLAGQSGWSWTGGQIFFISRDRLARSRADGWDPTGPGTEGWLPGDVHTTVLPQARGTEILTVSDSSTTSVGEMVLLEIDNLQDRRLLKEIAGNIEGAETYDWATRAAAIAAPPRYADFESWRWPVKVVEIVSPTQIRIEQPLRVEIYADTPARLRGIGATVHDSGVENLTIENALLTQTAHNQNPGSNGVCFQAVYDCWAKNIHVLNADLAFGMTSAKSCTLSGISAGGRSLHHFVACRVMSHDNVIEDFLLEEFTIPAVTGSYLHGLNLEGLSSGNVYQNGTLRTGTFDSHRQMPFENLRTNITLTNKDSVPGGGRDAGPFFGARTDYWGVHVTNNANIGIEISDIAGKSFNAGITGLTNRGSVLPRIGQDFSGDLQAICLEFGTDLNPNNNLLQLQRALAPVPE